jgi:hypothetical protein
MFSFQPAAFVGEDRWYEDYRDVTGDQVWAQVEAGAGTRLDYRVFDRGDDQRDLAAREAFFRYQFMDAADVRSARELMQRGETSADPLVRRPRNGSRPALCDGPPGGRDPGAGLLAAVWVAGLVTGSIAHRPPRWLSSHVGAGLPSLGHGYWWTPLSAGMWASGLGTYCDGPVDPRPC